MTILLLLVGAAFLLLLNGFFVLAEFAIVKVRSSRIEELVQDGHPQAKLLQQIHHRLDEYLSVCQVGITLASVALGMVGEQATQALTGGDGTLLRYLVAMAFSYIVVSGSHIVLGELVPKSIAIRVADRAALRVARPLRFFHWLFFLPLWILNRIANICLRLLGFPGQAEEGVHSEDELRIILDHSQEGGLLSFRRLLFIENVFDLGELKVKDAMRTRQNVRCLDVRLPWPENEAVIRASRYSRFPLIADDSGRPVGIVHVKDLVYSHVDGRSPDLLQLKRPVHAVAEGQPLEQILSEMQRRRQQLALVFNAQGTWTGLISFEDILEEIVGTVGDEFENEPAVYAGDVITTGRVVLDVEAPSIPDAVRIALGRVPDAELPLPKEQLVRAVLERERLAPTYLGRGIAMPHARLKDLDKPVLVFARSAAGIPAAGKERAQLLFILLTPAGQPRIHQRLQARIAGILENSEYVDERLRDAASAQDVLEVIRTGEQAALD
jgi:CBS domain containing-hemolysin-like protein/mannitol/fructose-specific phosphotransferase system IIA component